MFVYVVVYEDSGLCLIRAILQSVMVILTVGICNKDGQVILSRQFQGMTRSTVQQIYLSFPKLIKPNQQHTYVQSPSYTFLYIPLQQLYLVTVSSKNSNIIQDQQTIRLLYKVISGVCQQGLSQGKEVIQVESVQKHAVDIILATDDVVSMGYRESVTIGEVQSQLKMDSAQQKAHIALLKQQEQDAKLAAEKANRK